MKLYLISRRGSSDYDTYDSAVVAATSSKDAKNIHPDGCSNVEDDRPYGTWVNDLADIEVKVLGETKLPRGVICASFNAG